MDCSQLDVVSHRQLEEGWFSFLLHSLSSPAPPEQHSSTFPRPLTQGFSYQTKIYFVLAKAEET